LCLYANALGLQVREGGKKGVYVENLSEVAVGSVQDVVRLLLLVRVANDETMDERMLHHYYHAWIPENK